MELKNLTLPMIIAGIWWVCAFSFGFIKTILWSIVIAGLLGMLLVIWEGAGSDGRDTI